MFGSINKILKRTQGHLNNTNMGGLATFHLFLYSSLKKSLASPKAPILMNLEAEDIDDEEIEKQIFAEDMALINVGGLQKKIKNSKKKLFGIDQDQRELYL